VLRLIAVALVLAVAPAIAQDRIVMATGAKGGTFYDYGPGLAAVIGAGGGPAIAILETGGSTDNVRLVDSGGAQLGLANMGPVYEAWNASEPWVGGRRMTHLRALFPMYETPFHVAALARSGVGSIVALDGKRVGLGPPKGPAEAVYRALFAELHIAPQVTLGGPDALAIMVIDGRLDAFAYGAGLPLPAFQAIEAAAPMRVFGLTEREADLLRRRFPYMAPYTIAPGSYRDQTAPVGTVAVWNFVIASAELPDDTAYRIVRAVLDQPERVAAIHEAARATIARNAVADTFLPFHPGARRYYAEHGITLAAPSAP
jgi:TRAP transporter TAXI family solute receptor